MTVDQLLVAGSKISGSGDDAGVRRAGVAAVRAVARAGDDEHPTVGKPGHGRIPASVSHRLDVGPRVRRGIEDRGVLDADVRVDVSADDQDPAVGERRVARTEQVRGVVVRDLGERVGDRIPDTRVRPAVRGAVEDQELAVREHARMDRHDGEGGRRAPLTDLRGIRAAVGDRDGHRSRGRLVARPRPWRPPSARESRCRPGVVFQ